MLSRSRALLVGLVVLLAPTGCGEPPARFDGARALTWVERLAADEMEGRRTGTAAGRRAADAIATAFAGAGLEPLPGATDYFHRFRFPFFRFTQPLGLSFELTDGREDLVWGRDYYFVNGSTATAGAGLAAYAGYGITSERYDDYAGIDVAGRVVLAMQGLPPGVPLESALASSVRKAELAHSHGAAGLLLFGDPDAGSTFPETRIWVFRPERMLPDFFTGRIDVPVADRMLEGRAAALKRQIVERGAPASELLATHVEWRVSVEHDPTAMGENVLGVIPGSDPSRADEVVIVGAHYDGGGPDPDGTIYNGAEDNASGTAAVIELARVMAAAPSRPARTILFAAWGAEEQGTWGSRRFLERHVVDPDDIAVVFTLDNVGVGEGRFRLFGARNFPEIHEAITGGIAEELNGRFTPRGAGGSDGYPFQELGIPSLFAHADAPQPWVHLPEDDADTISAEMLQVVGDFTQRAARLAADLPAGELTDPLRLERYLARYPFVVGWLGGDSAGPDWSELASSGIDLVVIQVASSEQATSWRSDMPDDVLVVQDAADLTPTEAGEPIRALFALTGPGADPVAPDSWPGAFVRVRVVDTATLELFAPDQSAPRWVRLVTDSSPLDFGDAALTALDLSSNGSVLDVVTAWRAAGVQRAEIPVLLGGSLRPLLQLALVDP